MKLTLTIPCCLYFVYFFLIITIFNCEFIEVLVYYIYIDHRPTRKENQEKTK